MNTPETINVEKYINALDNLLGADNAYYAGDPDVDAIMEVIMTAMKLEDRVKELTEKNEKLQAQRYLKYDLHTVIDLKSVLDNTRKDAIDELIDRLLKESHYEYLLDGTDNYYCFTYNQIDKIAKEMLEENK